jgi:hypothetical protein
MRTKRVLTDYGHGLIESLAQRVTDSVALLANEAGHTRRLQHLLALDIIDLSLGSYVKPTITVFERRRLSKHTSRCSACSALVNLAGAIGMAQPHFDNGDFRPADIRRHVAAIYKAQ